MIQAQLITLADIRAVKSIALNINQEKELIPYILEAQNFDLMKFLGVEFYVDLVNDFTASPSLDKYQLLFNGGSYTSNGKSLYLNGLKSLLIYYVYRRYANNSNVIATPTGFVHKTNNYSENVSEKTISRLVDNANASALMLEDELRNFLNKNKADYPLWGGCKVSTNRVKIRQV